MTWEEFTATEEFRNSDVENMWRNAVFFGIGVGIVIFLSKLWIVFGYLGFAIYALLAVVKLVPALVALVLNFVFIARSPLWMWYLAFLQIVDTAIELVYVAVLWFTIFA